jgi:hypothetical protein
MKLATQQELRAYISVRPVSIKGFAPDHGPVVLYKMTNTGSTPAYKVLHAASLFLMKYPAMKIGGMNFEGVRAPVTIFPQETH